jgi:hypothetical protein
MIVIRSGLMVLADGDPRSAREGHSLTVTVGAGPGFDTSGELERHLVLERPGTRVAVREEHVGDVIVDAQLLVLDDGDAAAQFVYPTERGTYGVRVKYDEFGNAIRVSATHSNID